MNYSAIVEESLNYCLQNTPNYKHCEQIFVRNGILKGFISKGWQAANDKTKKGCNGANNAFRKDTHPTVLKIERVDNKCLRQLVTILHPKNTATFHLLLSWEQNLERPIKCLLIASDFNLEEATRAIDVLIRIQFTALFSSWISQSLLSFADGFVLGGMNAYFLSYF